MGPTLEFYALVAAELQKKSLGIWLCDDDYPDDQSRPVRVLTERIGEIAMSKTVLVAICFFLFCLRLTLDEE